MHLEKLQISEISETCVLYDQGGYNFSSRGYMVVGVDGVIFGLKNYLFCIFYILTPTMMNQIPAMQV